MYYRLAAAVAALLALTTACRVEPTPREYIDRQLPAADVQARAEATLRDHLTVLIQALQTGDVETARSVLQPAAGVIVIGPGGGERFTGPAEFDAVLELASTALPGRLVLRDLEVRVSTRATVGWFAVQLDLQRPDAEPLPLRVTGVYVEREGSWELQLAHLSVPAPALTGAPAYPRQEAAPAEGG